MAEKGFYIGINKDGERVYIQDFSWDCGWYWGGGYVQTRSSHQHFNSLFLKGGDCIEARNEHFEKCKISEGDWWRLCDLFKQFYAHKESARCFHSGGHYTSKDRKEDEINKEMEDKINKHIEDVVIREIRLLLEK